MMPEAHQDALTYLIIAIAALFAVIIGTVLLSQLRRRGAEDQKVKTASQTRALPDTHPESPKQSKTPELVKVGAEGLPTQGAGVRPDRASGSPATSIPIDGRSGVPGEASTVADAVTAGRSETANLVSSALEKDVDLRSALRATESQFFGRLRSLFASKGSNTALEEVEEVLYTSDLGPQTVQTLLGGLSDSLNRHEIRDAQSVRDHLRQQLLEIFDKVPMAVSLQATQALRSAANQPRVIMIVGVNGAGKTTSIGKISAQLAAEGRKVLIAAGDTFRAAAGAQLKVWSERAQVEIFSPEGITDPSAVAYDAVAKAKGQGFDDVLIDTAGRLHTQANLMDELKKVKRVIQKLVPDAPHEVLLVLDANSGQNALVQAKEFNKALEVTGAILTKMDGTAKGGVAIGLVHETGIPVKMIGVGERIRDLRPFSPKEFVDSILGL